MMHGTINIKYLHNILKINSIYLFLQAISSKDAYILRRDRKKFLITLYNLRLR